MIQEKMVGSSQPHRVLVKSNVLFLGHSPPTPNALELEALRNPLRKAYPAHSKSEIEGINAWLTIYTSGIQLQLVDGHHPPVFWFPIQNLYLAAANKCINYIDQATGDIQESKFVELGMAEAEQSSHAPLFSFISKRSEGSEMQCYTFMTKNADSAFSLVNASEFAFQNKTGHTNRKIPSELAAEELVPGSDDGSSTSSADDGPIVINVDDRHDPQSGDLFPRRLVRKHRLEQIRPSRSFDRRGEQPAPLRVNSVGPPRLQSPRYEPPVQRYGPIPIGIRAPEPPRVRERVKVVQPPPLFIKAPPPKVMVIKEPPKVVQTPPQIIREVVDRPYPVEKEVIKEVEVPVPYPVRSPTPPPVYLRSEPEIVEREVRVEVPVEVPVPYHVRSPTPPPQIVAVPEYIEREVHVPVPYEVRARTPPPQVVEVPVQVPVYVEVEGPPQIIREPPRIQEIPVPYPVEVPYQVPVEVPHFFPVPLKDRRSSRRSRREQRYGEYYNGNVLDRRYDRGYFIPPEFQEQPAYDYRYASRREEQPRRSTRRRERSSSSESSSRREEYRGNRDYGLSNGVSGIRITNVDDRVRARSDHSPGGRREDRHRRHDRPGEVDGYDFYRPIPERKSSKHRKSNRDRRDRQDDYYIKERRTSPNRNYSDNDLDRAFSPTSFSDGRGAYYGQLPAHLSDSVSEFPHQRSSRSRAYATYY